jgi:integrase
VKTLDDTEKCALLNFKLKQNYPVKERYRAWDAIVAWRDHVFQAPYMRITKCNYLTGMLKLIEANIIDLSLKLKDVNETWFNEALSKIDNMNSWSHATKPPRKTCLKSFYQFATTFDPDYLKDYELHCYEWLPSSEEVKHMLSCVEEKAPLCEIDTPALIYAMLKVNRRDCLIMGIMLFTGCTLDEALDLNREDIGHVGEICYVRLKKRSGFIPRCLMDLIIDLTKNPSHRHLFVTVNGKRILRTQVARNLKLAARNIGVPFDLTPKILHGYVNAGFLRDKRSVIEKLFSD